MLDFLKLLLNFFIELFKYRQFSYNKECQEKKEYEEKCKENKELADNGTIQDLINIFDKK